MSGVTGTTSGVPRFLQATKASSARENSRHAYSQSGVATSHVRVPSRERDNSATRRMSPKTNIPSSTTASTTGSGNKEAHLKRSNSMPTKRPMPCRDPNGALKFSSASNHRNEGDQENKIHHKPVIKGCLSSRVNSGATTKPMHAPRENVPASSNANHESKLRPKTANAGCGNHMETKAASNVHVMKPTLKRAESARAPTSKKPYLVSHSSNFSSSAVNQKNQIDNKTSSAKCPEPKVVRTNSGNTHASHKERLRSTSNSTAVEIVKERKDEEKMDTDEVSVPVLTERNVHKAENNSDETIRNEAVASCAVADGGNGGQENQQRNLSNPCSSSATTDGEKKVWSLSDFEFGTALGRGRFGCVYVAREKTSKFIVAIKVLFKKDLETSRITRQVKREIEVQSHLKHPHILRLYSYFQDQLRIYIVLEYASKGELYKYLKQQGKFTQEQTAKYIYQLSSALLFLEKLGVIHRDLKPENLLLDSKFDLRLADFGWSVHSPDMPRNTLCGTPDYLSPEMLLGHEYSAAVDVWSMGVLCFEFLHGKPPFETPTIKDTYERIKKVDIQWPETFEEDVRRFISGMLKFEPKKRSALVDIMTDPWIEAHYQPPQNHPSQSNSSKKVESNES